MSQVAVWLDRTTARIFKFMNNQLSASSVRNDSTGKALFTELAKDIGAADALLILGPGVAKHHFFNHLIEHHPVVAKKILGCEHSERVSDGQIVTKAQQCFSGKVPA